MNNTTQFDAVNRIWYGTKSEVTIHKHHNFGEIILQKLNGEDSGRVMQVSILNSWNKSVYLDNDSFYL